MKQIGLAPVTLLFLVLTCLLLPATGWLQGRSMHAPSRYAGSRGLARSGDLSSSSVWRYRSNQPTHWRYLMLHH
jgi:hypothetical protein